MRIIVFIHSLSSGGAERVTVNLANYWSEESWDVTVVTMVGVEQDFYTLHHSVHRLSLNMDAVSESIFSAIVSNFRRLYAIRKVLKAESPDVALAMMSTANILLALAAAGTGITTIGSERIHPPKLPIDRVWSLLRRMIYPALDAVVAQTNESARWLRSTTKARQVSVIPNPVVYPLANHVPLVTPEMVIENECGGKILLAVGRLAKQKGFDRLLLAFEKLSPLFPDWSLVILGEGDCRNELENMVADLDLKNKVFLPGTVGNVGEWYKVSDLYVMTSLFEGFPNTLVEALAYGLPSVSVDCETGPRDIVQHEVNGLLVPQGDNDALVESLAKLMGDEVLRKNYTDHAIEVRKKYSIEKISDMWEELFCLAIK